MQLALAVEMVAHSFTDEAFNVAGDAAESFVSMEIVWFVSYAPLEVSSPATGGAGIVTVRVEVAV